MAGTVSIAEEILARMIGCARENPGCECCGLLAGRGGAITHILPAANAAGNTKTGYEIAPAELFRLMREIRAAGLDLLGIYHSHPNGRNEPSPTDIERAYYPETAYFILSPRDDTARPVRAFSIREGRAAELSIHSAHFD